MKKRMLSIFVALVLAISLVVPASATPSTSALGDIIPFGPDNGMLTGSLSGTYTITEIHGQVNRLYFEGSVDGVTGTLSINLVEVRPNGLGYWTILGGTGDLANLHGQGTFMFPDETTGSYEGQVHFD